MEVRQKQATDEAACASACIGRVCTLAGSRVGRKCKALNGWTHVKNLCKGRVVP